MLPDLLGELQVVVCLKNINQWALARGVHHALLLIKQSSARGESGAMRQGDKAGEANGGGGAGKGLMGSNEGEGAPYLDAAVVTGARVDKDRGFHGVALVVVLEVEQVVPRLHGDPQQRTERERGGREEETQTGRDGETWGQRKRERERERESVCVCVCVCECE